MKKPTSIDLQGSTILVVDDEAMGLIALVEYLESAGFEVVSAKNGEEGLQRAIAIQPDLILLDVVMPGIDGFEACRRLKANPKTAVIPVIFMTGMTYIANKVEGFAVGGVDYITKPLQIDEVMARVRTHLTLYKLQHELEDQVAARTAELEAEIDTRKRAQADLHKANQLLERIFEQTHILIAYLDPDFNFVRVNRAYAQSDDREPAFFIGKRHFDLYPDAENEAIFRNVVETGEPHFEFAKPFEYADYPERGVNYRDWSLMSVRDEAGEVVGLVLTLLDVTSRKRAEEELQRHREHLEALVAERTQALRERIKDLDCLYSISRLVERSEVPLHIILENTVTLLPPAWRYPDDAGAQIMLDGRVFKTHIFTETARWRQTAEISVHNEPRGIVEVCYANIDHHVDNPFLKSERDLLDAVAERLGHIVERWETEEALEERLRFETLLAELAVAFVHFSERTLEEEIGRWLQRTSELLHLDRCRLFELNAEMTEAHSLYGSAPDGAVLPPFQVTRKQLPHIFERIIGKKPFVFSGGNNLPPEAALERAFFSVENIAASLIVPLQEGTMALVAMRVDIEDALATAYAEGAWPDVVVQQLHLIGEVLANALLRERAELALHRQAEEQARHAEELAMLYAITAAAAGFLEPEALLKAALDAMLSALHADSGWVTLPGPTMDDPPHIAIWQGLPELPPGNKDLNVWQNCPAYNAFINSCEPKVQPTAMDQCACIIAQNFEVTVGPLALQSHISVPLCVGDQVLGVLNVAWSTPDTPDLNRDLLRTIGQQIGIALHNAELYQHARQVDQLRALNTISATANASLDLDTVLHRIIDLTCHTFDAEEGAILLWDSASQALVFATSLQRDQVLKGRQLSPDQGIAGWVMQYGQPVRVDDVHQDPRWYAGVDADTEFTSHNLLCAPLIYRGDITGVIEILNKRQGAFTEDDLSLLEAVAAIAASNIENARLFAATRARAEELELLNKIGLTLSASLNPTEVIDTALIHVERLFHTSGIGLILVDAVTGEYYFSQARIGAIPVDIPIRIPSGSGLVGEALAQRRTILVEDLQQDPRYLAHLYQDLEIQAKAGIAAPLLIPDSELGLIVVISDQIGAYTPEDVRVLESLASMLSIALENARLYADLKTALHDHKRAEAQLVHAEKMGALGRLAASIAHEINNPLQAILGGLELAMEEVNERGAWAVLEEELRLASTEVERVADIVSRMREFYRPGQAGFQTVDLHRVFEEVLALSRKRLQHAHVRVERAWNLDGAEIQANEDQLKQVFLNLILNAVDAMPEGGTLHIATAMDEVQDPEHGTKSSVVRIEFSDTGMGIPQDVLPHVFEPFFTTKSSGTGLGLSISHSIVDAHNGTLTVASHVGLGTTFTMRLPVTFEPSRG